MWPPPYDRDADLNSLPDTAWLDDLGRAARDRLATTRSTAPIIGHCDWESHNLDFRDGRPWAVHDWDSVASAAETVIVGVAAAMWPAGSGNSTGASLVQSQDFIDAYQQARGRDFSAQAIEETWAAGLWIRAFNAKKFLLDGLDAVPRRSGRTSAPHPRYGLALSPVARLDPGLHVADGQRRVHRGPRALAVAAGLSRQ